MKSDRIFMPGLRGISAVFGLIGWLAGVVAVCQARGDSVTLQPSADTSLFETAPNNNLGGSLSLVAGSNASGFRSRALLRFDLAGNIPSNAVIQSVALTVTVVTLPGGGGADSIFDLRRVLGDWGEGAGSGNQGSPAGDGEATWNNRFYPSATWTVPGGAVSNDFSAGVSASMLVSNLGGYTFSSTSNLVADAQAWLSTPAANFGWALMSESETLHQTARRFGAREDPVNAASLAVQYVLPSAPDIQWITASGNQIHFGFLAQAGRPYSVQYSDTLAPGGWLILTNIPPQTVTTNIVIADPLSANLRRFYRIAAPF